jgi:hypothetical protein
MDLTVLEYTIKFIIWYLHYTQKRHTNQDMDSCTFFYSAAANKKTVGERIKQMLY